MRNRTPPQARTDELPPSLFALALIMSGGLAAIMVYALQSASLAQFAAIIGAGVAIAGAALLVGGLLGFLFGIPRRLQQEFPLQESRANASSQEESTQRGVGYTGNTNLEQISDWLTKILVGVGLTQIAGLPTLLENVGRLAAPGLGGFAGSAVFAVGIVLFFGVGGLLLGYLWTRLFLGAALTQAERAALGMLEKRLSQLEQQTELDVKALTLVERQLAEGSEKEAVPQEELNAAIRAASDSVKSHTFYRAQAVRWRNWRDEATKPIMERTIPIFRALANSDIENRYHANHAQLGYARKISELPIG